MNLSDAIREHADIVFPAGAYPEKEGTVVHPDGRIQRLRPAVAKPGESRAEWQVLADVAARVGLDLEVLTGGMASQQLFDAVPQYAGPHARGDRRQGHSSARARDGGGLVMPSSTPDGADLVTPDTRAGFMTFPDAWEAKR